VLTAVFLFIQCTFVYKLICKEVKWRSKLLYKSEDINTNVFSYHPKTKQSKAAGEILGSISAALSRVLLWVNCTSIEANTPKKYSPHRKLLTITYTSTVHVPFNLSHYSKNGSKGNVTVIITSNLLLSSLGSASCLWAGWLWTTTFRPGSWFIITHGVVNLLIT